MDSYQQFVSHVFGILQTLGIYESLRWLVMFFVVVAGFFAFLKVLSGQLGG